VFVPKKNPFTNFSVDAMTNLSNQLNVFALFRCAGITDSGILAIARGCPSLEMINLAYCKEITDNSLLSLSKCSKLNTVESRGCPHITSLGLAQIAARCKQLTKLDIKKCYKIDDAGMIPLAHFSQNLKQVPMIPFLSLLGHNGSRENIDIQL
jgi:F-box/leucine-rich repeat protein 2/20